MLLSVPAKIMNRIILERMKKAVDTVPRDNQAGFRQMQEKTTDLVTTSSQRGLKVNLSKTKIMRVNNKSTATQLPTKTQ